MIPQVFNKSSLPRRYPVQWNIRELPEQRLSAIARHYKSCGGDGTLLRFAHFSSRSDLSKGSLTLVASVVLLRRPSSVNTSRLRSNRLTARIFFGSRPTILRKGTSIAGERLEAGDFSTNSSTGTSKLEHKRLSTGVSLLKSPFRKRLTREASTFADLATFARGFEPAALFNLSVSFSTLIF